MIKNLKEGEKIRIVKDFTEGHDQNNRVGKITTFVKYDICDKHYPYIVKDIIGRGDEVVAVAEVERVEEELKVGDYVELYESRNNEVEKNEKRIKTYY